MLIGQNDREIEALAYPHTLHLKESGLTLIEILVSAFVLLIIITALFLSLTTGEFSHSLSSAKVDLQAKVRRAMDWMVKDVRQTNLIEINTNNPSGNHIKFKQVRGINNATGSYALSSNYIEYSYDNITDGLTRNEVNASGSILRSWVFSNISEASFYTAPGVLLAPGDVLASKKLIITVSGTTQVRNSLNLNYSLTEEVKIRNE